MKTFNTYHFSKIIQIQESYESEPRIVELQLCVVNDKNIHGEPYKKIIQLSGHSNSVYELGKQFENGSINYNQLEKKLNLLGFENITDFGIKLDISKWNGTDFDHYSTSNDTSISDYLKLKKSYGKLNGKYKVHIYRQSEFHYQFIDEFYTDSEKIIDEF